MLFDTDAPTEATEVVFFDEMNEREIGWRRLSADL